MTDLNKFGHLYQLQRFGGYNAQWGFGGAKQSLSVCVCCLTVRHPMYQIVDLSRAVIAVRVGCSLVQSGLVLPELLPLACPDLCNQCLVSSACQAIVVPQFIMGIYVFAQLVFNGGVLDVPFNELLDGTEANRPCWPSVSGGFFCSLVRQLISRNVDVRWNPGDVNVGRQLL